MRLWEILMLQEIQDACNTQNYKKYLTQRAVYDVGCNKPISRLHFYNCIYKSTNLHKNLQSSCHSTKMRVVVALFPSKRIILVSLK